MQVASAKILRVRLGQTIDELQLITPWFVPPAHLESYQPVMFTEPIILHYECDAYSFELPPGLTSGFTIASGIVIHAFATPHLRYLAAMQAEELCREIGVRLRAAKWIAERDLTTNREQLAIGLRPDRGFLAGRWRCDGDVARLVVTRTDPGGDLLVGSGDDRYQVELRLDNDEIREAAVARVKIDF